MKKTVLIYAFLLLLILPFQLFGQDDNFWDQFLEEEVEVENPVYKPVIGFGTGILNFMGDVSNDFTSPLIGQLGYKVNIATFVDNKHYFRTNFFFITGSLSGSQTDIDPPVGHLNFQTEIFNFGINLNYNFKNFYTRQDRRMFPFFSVGVETFLYNPKADLYYISEGIESEYHFWSDGTIRNIDEQFKFDRQSTIITRDYIYETDLRDADNNFFNKELPAQNYSFAIPVDLGLDFSVSDRVTLRLGTSIHYTFTDFLDNLSGTFNEKDGINYGGNALNDMFMYTYATIHLDLFSDDKTIIERKLFADIDFDPTLLSDEDYDGVFDVSDECMDTPSGVQVDTVGCPFDDDNDGVPNYKDREPLTDKGAIVDDFGVTMQEDQLIALIENNDAVKRSEVDLYVLNYASANQFRGLKDVKVPDKYTSVDKDNDGYISFEEVMEAIDNFFDFESDLTTQEIYELNDFFFSQ